MTYRDQIQNVMIKPMQRSPNQEVPVTPRQAYYGLFVLWLVNLLGNIDRFSVGLVLQQIKIDLNLTETQVGLVSGASFVVAYVAFGIPVARWLDRGIRRNILAWSVGLWSLMAMACGAATNFVQIALARAGLGAGEAACIPGAISLIGDYFRRERRTQAVGIFNTAVAAAGIVGTPVVGIVTDYYGWRVAVISFGLFGLIVAAIVGLTLREPVRASLKIPDVSRNQAAGANTLMAALRVMFADRAYRYLILAHALYGVGLYAWIAWYPVSLVRTYGMTYTEVGTFIGTWLGITMVIGSLASGFLCPAIVRRTGNERWLVILPALFCLISAPAMAVTSLDVSKPLAMVSGGVVLFMALARTPPTLALTMELLPASMHSFTTMVFVIVTNNIGAAVGPIIVGLISDSVMTSVGEGPALRHGMLWTTPVFGLVGALMAFLPACFIPRKLATRPSPDISPAHAGR